VLNYYHKQAPILNTVLQILYANAAEEIINTHDPADPLFLYVALQNVHSPLDAPQEYLDIYQGYQLTGPRKKVSGFYAECILNQAYH